MAKHIHCILQQLYKTYKAHSTFFWEQFLESNHSYTQKLHLHKVTVGIHAVKIPALDVFILLEQITAKGRLLHPLQGVSAHVGSQNKTSPSSSQLLC